MASPALLAAAGEVGGDFFKERSSGTLPCQADETHLFCFDWAKENIDRYGTPTMQHLELVLLSVAIGFVIAFALALIAHRTRWLQPPLLAATGILYTIPSIAFFFLLLPVTGFGRDTAIIVLSAYTLQIIYRNTMLGFDNVPDSVKDAARGMGLTNRQILWKVELPLATPEIIAGLRVATASTIAITTLVVLISAGGLGTEMYGSNFNFPTAILIAVAIIALMVLAFDLLLLSAQRLLTPWRKVRPR
ncbi:MAG TPA: ABC transporter permease [Solirubrobacterales bacterium]|nr:ABC transporter permease [Solirubrobacterales bacterium]